MAALATHHWRDIENYLNMHPAYAIATRMYEPIDHEGLTNAPRGVRGLTAAVPFEAFSSHDDFYRK